MPAQQEPKPRVEEKSRSWLDPNVCSVGIGTAKAGPFDPFGLRST